MGEDKQVKQMLLIVNMNKIHVIEAGGPIFEY
jgi:hypothetical protein